MDSEQARTFLILVAAGSFSAAAERLHVTQSTVSARIQALERQMGARLFVRNKAGAVLTAAGRQFQRHATTLVRTVEQARRDVGSARDFRATLTIGGRFGLWEHVLLDWLTTLRRDHADLAVRMEIGFEEDLMLGLVDGRLDIAVMYTPQSRPGLIVETLFEEELVLVASASGDGAQTDGGHVLIDWGPEFHARHAAQFPETADAALTFNIGWLGLQYILARGGSGYFPRALVADHIEQGRVRLLADAPVFRLPAFAVVPRDDERDVLAPALNALRSVVAAMPGANAQDVIQHDRNIAMNHD